MSRQARHASSQVHTMQWHIIPQPSSIVPAEGYLRLGLHGRITIDTQFADMVTFFAQQLVDDIAQQLGLHWQLSRGNKWQSVVFMKRNSHCPPQGYTLTIGENAVVIEASDAEGARNGTQTLRQLIQQCGCTLPHLTIHDKPSYTTRGYYLDVTRGRVPTLQWLKTWADTLCLYKYNQLQLYIEHTMAFDDCSEFWRGSCPLSTSDIMEFDDYCQRLGIELVPSISTFGHLYMALRTYQWRTLGEFPETADRPFSFVERMAHHTLNIFHEDAFDFAYNLVKRYVQLFHSKQCNICADETFDLGKGASLTHGETSNIADMYASFVNRLCTALSDSGYQPMLWADVVIDQPEVLSQLPSNVTLLNWQYDPNATDETVQRLHKAGCRQIMCPAVHCWNTLLPLVDEAWNNIARLASFGKQNQAQGVLITDWGDYGHVNDPRLAIPGLTFGAQHAWCASAEEASTSPQRQKEEYAIISQVVYQDASGRFLTTLNRAAHKACFTWNQLVWYCELDDGTGHINEEVYRTLARMLPDIPIEHVAHYTLTQARTCMMQRLSKQYEDPSFATTQTRLQYYEDELTTNLISSHQQGLVAPIKLACKGQYLLNELGRAFWQIANGDCTEQHKCAWLALANELELWAEDYATVWRTVSRESELHRILQIIWTACDVLRQHACKQ